MHTSKFSRPDSVFTKHFSQLTDSRRTSKGNIRHLLHDILLLIISAILSDCDNWEEIEDFGKQELEWLKTIGDFSNGCPSHDTLSRVFSSLNPEEFNKIFITWTLDLSNLTQGEVIAVDGKTCRGAYEDSSNKHNLPHIVSAFASKNKVCLAQVKVDKKSNEITAIPKLIDLLSLKDTIVTIDAMGCQAKIAKKIIDAEADYILAVKENQPILVENIKTTVNEYKPASIDIDEDFGHGRIEKRECLVYDYLGVIENQEKWKNLTTLIKVKSITFNKRTNKQSTEVRFYISSLKADAKYINSAIRSHWSIENNLHWNLDVCFKEDNSRKRIKNSAQNMNIMYKMALNLIVKNKIENISKNRLRKKARGDSKIREKLLGF